MRFNNIQVLRFVAAAGVVLYHAHNSVGALIWKTPLTRLFDYHFSWGVELFFVISGFVVSHSLAQMPAGRFFVYRLIRIYPALWLATGAFVAWRFVFAGVQPDWPRMLLTLSLLPSTGEHYYALGGIEWTLVYEVFFYSLLSAISCLPWGNAREWAMVLWVGLIAGAALWTPMNATVGSPSAATIVFSAFNLPFIAGVLVHAWFSRTRRLPVVGLACTVPVALYAAHRVDSTVVQLAMQAVGFGALVLLAAQASRRHDAAATNPLVKLGDWSYALYLVHLPIVQHIATLFEGRPDQADLAFVIAVAAGLVGGALYGSIELRLYHRAKAALARSWRLQPAG